MEIKNDSRNLLTRYGSEEESFGKFAEDRDISTDDRSILGVVDGVLFLARIARYLWTVSGRPYDPAGRHLLHRRNFRVRQEAAADGECLKILG